MGAVKSLQGGKSEVDKNIGGKEGKEAHLTMGGDQALQNERISVKTLRPNSPSLWYFGLCYCKKLGARGSRMESRLQRGNPLYLSCCEDRICFRKNTRLTIVECGLAIGGRLQG
jgi:hypothetical protein